MKTSTLITAAALMFVAGTMFTEAATSGVTGSVGATYTEAFTATNNVAIVDVVGIPASTNIFVMGSAVTIDGLGKITGVAALRITSGVSGIQDNTWYGDFQTTVSGRVTSKGTTTTIQIAMKGSGYTSTNDSPTIPIVSSNAQNASVNLAFSGLFDNSAESGTLPPITGTLAGTVKSSLFKAKGSGIFNDPTTAEYATATDFNLNLGGLTIQFVQIGKKLYGAISDGVTGFQGSGGTSSKNFSLSLKGVGDLTGSSMKISGPTAPLNLGSGFIVPFAPSTNGNNITITGKVYGQTLSVTGASASPSL